MNYNLTKDGDCINSFGNSTDNIEIFEKIASVIAVLNDDSQPKPDNNIYTKARQKQVKGKGKNFNKKENLLSKNEAVDWLSRGGNIGIALGVWIGGYIYVNFDIENEEALDDKTRSVIDTHTVVRFKTKHENTNRVVRISDGKAYDLLRSHCETHTHLTEGESDDIEIITKGHAVIPPSEYNHIHCSENKPCNQQDRTTSYLLDWVKDSNPMSYDTVEQIGELLELQSDDTDDSEPHTSTDDLDTVPSVEPTKNILNEFNDNVPSVHHTFTDRKEYMLSAKWKGQEQFIQLLNGDFSSISGSQKQHKAECKIANTIGFFYGRNEQIIKFFMDSLNFETHYEKYPKHRKQLLEWATNVDWCYCQGVSFHTKHDVAATIYYTDNRTVKEIARFTDTKDDQIRRALDIIEAEGKITTNEQRQITQIEITEGYLNDLESVIAKYRYSTGKGSDIEKETNVTRMRL
jgi:hypothetical protein